VKKFAGHKTIEQITAQCKALKLDLDARRWYELGDDHIVVRGGGAYAIYSTFNGRFFGRTDTGIEFNSDSAKHDKKPWMQALLRFFYVEKPQGAAHV
jgi:hypothetical protein